MNYDGVDIDAAKKSSAEMCQSECANKPKCVHFVWEINSKNCRLKSNIENPTHSKQYISGPRSCGML